MRKSLSASVLSLAQLPEQQSPAPPPLDRHGRIKEDVEWREHPSHHLRWIWNEKR